MKKLLLLVCVFSFFNAQSQIVIDNNPPYNTANFLIDSVLLGGGVTAANHSFQGATSQIGFFNAINTSLGIDSGIVMSTGDIYSLDPSVFPAFPLMPVPAITDPDLLNVAQSVPGLIGQSFTVSSVNDIAILEFDFIPTSDTLQFRYAFGSEEYFAWENSAYNDVFGFFLSGPGITGGFASPVGFPNGSVNLAVVPNTAPPLPITISSICNNPAGFPPAVMNPQYFVDNQLGLDTIASADGYTTILTAFSLVECGETYHMRLAIADGSDGSLDSYVWLEAGSFFSPIITVVDNLGIDSTVLEIPCGFEVVLTADGGPGAVYEWYDLTNANLVDTGASISVSNGTYYVISSDVSGCSSISDTFSVIAPPFALKDFTVSYTDVNCWNDSDGSVGISIDDYTNILSYNFFLDGTINSNSHPLDPFFSNVSQGVHLIQIVDSTYLCDTSFYISISAPGFPLQALASSEVTVCHGVSSGFVRFFCWR